MSMEASHIEWPIECRDVSIEFLYAHLFGDRNTDLGGNEIFMRPPKILIDTKVVEGGAVWKIKKALYGLRTSPVAWETERDNTLQGRNGVGGSWPIFWGGFVEEVLQKMGSSGEQRIYLKVWYAAQCIHTESGVAYFQRKNQCFCLILEYHFFFSFTRPPPQRTPPKPPPTPKKETC